MKRYIITGGPGSGKTSLIDALEQSGFCCSPEASRKLIVDLVAKKSEALPWLNLEAFAQLVLERMKELYRQPQASGVVFFDRGIPDIIAYLKASGLSVGEEYAAAATDHPYQKHVFILPPWQEIYVNDDERWQTFEESVALYEAIKSVYLDLNFHLVEVPKLPLNDRMAYVLNQVDLLSQSNSELNF